MLENDKPAISFRQGNEVDSEISEERTDLRRFFLNFIICYNYDENKSASMICGSTTKT